MYEMLIVFGKNSIVLENFNTPELARDFLLKFSKHNDKYDYVKPHDIEKYEWFLFDKHGNMELQGLR